MVCAVFLKQAGDKLDILAMAVTDINEDLTPDLVQAASLPPSPRCLDSSGVSTRKYKVSGRAGERVAA